MSNFNKAVNFLCYAVLPGRTLHPRQVEAIVTELQESCLLAPNARVIRTMEELRQFDEYTVFMNDWGDLFDVNNVQAGMKKEDLSYYFPCAVVASGDQVRSAREALEEEHG